MKYISDLTGLRDDEVVMVGSELIKAAKLKNALDAAFSRKVRDAIQAVLNSHEVKIYGQTSWLQDGISCEVLKLGASQWQKGKLRLKVALEFLSDEPENKELESAADQTNTSPLEEIRQLMNDGQINDQP